MPCWPLCPPGPRSSSPRRTSIGCKMTSGVRQFTRCRAEMCSPGTENGPISTLRDTDLGALTRFLGALTWDLDPIWGPKRVSGSPKRGVLGSSRGAETAPISKFLKSSASDLNRKNTNCAKFRRKTSQKELRNLNPGLYIWRRTKQRDQGSDTERPIVAEMTTTGFFVPLNQSSLRKNSSLAVKTASKSSKAKSSK